MHHIPIRQYKSNSSVPIKNSGKLKTQFVTEKDRNFGRRFYWPRSSDLSKKRFSCSTKKRNQCDLRIRADRRKAIQGMLIIIFTISQKVYLDTRTSQSLEKSRQGIPRQRQKQQYKTIRYTLDRIHEANSKKYPQDILSSADNEQIAVKSNLSQCCLDATISIVDLMNSLQYL